MAQRQTAPNPLIFARRPKQTGLEHKTRNRGLNYCTEVDLEAKDSDASAAALRRQGWLVMGME